MKLIDKAAVLAEIERTQKILNLNDCGGRSVMAWSEGFKNFLNCIEVKEVDEQKDSLTWQDINLIHHLLFDIKKDYDNGKLDKEEYYKEVLKQFKEQL